MRVIIVAVVLKDEIHMKSIGKMLIETLAIRSEKVRKNEKLFSFSFVTF